MMRKTVLNILSRTKPYLPLAWPLCALLAAALLWANLIDNLGDMTMLRQVGLMVGLAASVAIGFAVVLWSRAIWPISATNPWCKNTASGLQPATPNSACRRMCHPG